MSTPGLRMAQARMRAAGVSDIAIEVFSHNYATLASGATALIAEASIEPLHDPVLPHDPRNTEAGRAALDATVLIKLNGGLGTSMGLDRAKTLIPLHEGRTFLDLIVAQVKHARAQHGARLPLILMNSQRTRRDSLAVLAQHLELATDGLPLDFLQNAEPKLAVADLSPIEWPGDPALEWCPPGHGDLYPAILASGILKALLDRGYKYANVSNADNLGAAPNAQLAGWFARSGAPFALEVCRRTPADRKGGHPARRLDGRLILREIAQTAAEDLAHFSNELRHPFFNTNNIWLDLAALNSALVANRGVLGLPLIRNEKSVDPTDPASPRVIQLETAMGAAVEVFEGATAVEVGRERFLPVKTTNDLAVMRSDAYVVGVDAVPRLAAPTAPLVDLDPRFYSTLADFDRRFPKGMPSLRNAATLRVVGDWTFGADVEVHGDVLLTESHAPRRVPDGTRLTR